MTEFIKKAPSFSNMNQKMSVEAFTFGLKKAASRARELADVQQNNAWLTVAKILDEMRERGMQLARQKAMKTLDVDRALDQIKSRLVVN